MVILRKRVVGLTEAALQQFVMRAARAVRLEGTTDVLVTTSHELRSLNRRFRGKDRPTDVLSFPPALLLDGAFAGDIAISADIAAQNARRLGHPVAKEIKILALHGLLHLAGHDHERDQGEMSRKEGRLRRMLGLPSGLIARNNGKEGTTAEARQSLKRPGRRSKAVSKARAKPSKGRRKR